MGTTIDAFVKYDDYASSAYEYERQGLAVPDIYQVPPFSADVASLAWEPLCWDKEYEFFAAISGVRNRSSIEPLFPPRGFPARMSPACRRYFGEPTDDFECAGWLILSEINAALEHMSVRRDMLTFRVQLALDTMAYIEERLGTDRVRLVWGFSV